MPLVIPREAYARWIDMGADVSDLLAPTSTTLVATPVSTFVNSPKNRQSRAARYQVRVNAQLWLE
jgi:putative SOS response-associated peptidase YedK